MAGASDISTILSQTGRIEKINQNPFAQSELARQILTEEEAKARLHKKKEVVESKKSQEISVNERAKQERRKEGHNKGNKASSIETSEEEVSDQAHKHIIDVVI